MRDLSHASLPLEASRAGGEEGSTTSDALLSCLPVSVLIVDRQLRVRYGNRVPDGLTALGEGIGWPVGDLFSPSDGTVVERLIETAFESREIGEAEVQGADERFYLVRVQPRRKGQAPPNAVVTATNIDTLRTTQRALTCTLDSLEHALDPIFWVRPGGDFSFANCAAERSLGYGSDKFAHLTIWDLDPSVSPDEWKDLWQQLRKHQTYSYHTSLQRSDGTCFRAEMRLARLSPSEEEYIAEEFAILIARDVEDQLTLEEQLRHSQKMEAVGRLCGSVAHDFNNLLTVIECAGRFALEELDPTHPSYEEIGEILATSERAARLSSQLLAFSRRSPAEPRIINLVDIITGLEKILAKLLGENIELSTVAEENNVPALVDPGLLEQVVVNMVVNAQHAMQGVGQLTIRIYVQELVRKVRGRGSANVVPPGRFSCIEITDTGSGIPDEIIDKIFDPFFSTKGPGGGTGLGLSTCYGIVQQAGGHIQVDSASGQGTTFRVYVPHAKGNTACYPVVLPEVSRDARGTERILLVEDEVAIRTRLGRELRCCGYTVDEASNGVEALQYHAEGSTYDLLITDVVMPQMGGPRLVQAVRQQTPDLRVLYISGYVDELCNSDGSPTSIDGPVLAKPFAPADLVTKVRTLLDLSPTSSQHLGGRHQ